MPPAPGCAGTPYRAFDFWLGDWQVFDKQGALAGTSSISSEEYGCLLVGRWTSADGTTGQSYNFYDPVEDHWRQLWVSGGAVIDDSASPGSDGAMRLQGSIHYRGDGGSFPFRGTWTPNADGSVVQHFEQFDPKTTDWFDWFVGRYVRRPADAAAAN